MGVKYNDVNFVNESLGKTIVKTYMTTAQEPFIYSFIFLLFTLFKEIKMIA